MSTSVAAEIYFIGAMMILILVISFVTVFFFFRQYKKEMRDRKATASMKEQAGTSESAHAPDRADEKGLQQ
jgi:cbb3-type cytochrome oxidase subunit 3